MSHFLNLVSSVALLVWGTYLARSGILGVFGATLRDLLARNIRTSSMAVLAGMFVTALLQSGTATALILASFVGQRIVTLPTALAAMLGADVGSSIMTILFSFDLSWISPLFILIGVILFISRPATTTSRVGRILIGLGLMLLALRLISESTQVIVRSEAVITILKSLGSDTLLQLVTGALITILAYSSLAVVLFVATLAGIGTIPVDVAVGLVLGANLGSGILAVLATAKSPIEARQVPLGNLIFKLVGVTLAAPIVVFWTQFISHYLSSGGLIVVVSHFGFNVCLAVLFSAVTGFFARITQQILPVDSNAGSPERPNHLDPSALGTPALAISCAAREALYQADIVETMLQGLLKVIKEDDLKLSSDLRKLDDKVDGMYSSIKYYLTKVSRHSLDEKEGRRWSDIIAFTINMEQIGDIVEKVLHDIEEKKIKKGRNFSEAGMQEIVDLHARLVNNLRLAMSVFLQGSFFDAQKLLEEKTIFRDLERAYADTHINRLIDNTLQSMETSSLHLDLISDLKRINSLICSIAYPILDSAGALAPNRLIRDLKSANFR